MVDKPDDAEPTQQTHPYGKDEKGEPAKPETIPVPKRGEFFRDLAKVAGKEERSSASRTDDS